MDEYTAEKRNEHLEAAESLMAQYKPTAVYVMTPVWATMAALHLQAAALYNEIAP